MSDLHSLLIDFLNNLISDFDLLSDKEYSLIRGQSEKIGNVWQELRVQVLSTVRSIEIMTPELLNDKLKKSGVPPILIEWQIEECDKVCEPFHRITKGLKKREIKIGHLGDGLRNSVRPASRWYNIILGSLSFAFPLLGPVKEFDKAIAQLISY